MSFDQVVDSHQREEGTAWGAYADGYELPDGDESTDRDQHTDHQGQDKQSASTKGHDSRRGHGRWKRSRVQDLKT